MEQRRETAVEAERRRLAEAAAKRETEQKAQEDRMRAEREKRRREEDTEAKRRAEEEQCQHEEERRRMTAAEAEQRREAEAEERQRKAADAARRAEEGRRRQEADAARAAKPERPDEPRRVGRPTWLGWAIGGAAIAAVAAAVLFLIPQPAPPSAVSEQSPTVAVAPPAPAPHAPVAGSIAERPLSPDRERALKPKDTFSECGRCPEMLVVPAGSFAMGLGESGRGNDEGPQHKVTIAKPFAVSKFTLTFDNWDACVTDRGCGGYSPSDQGWGRGPFPVINVSWNDAQSYVAWLSMKTGKPYRLLTEAEYEYSTRAETQTAYWWGDVIGKGNTNCNACGSRWDGSQAAPVGSFAPNRFGLYDVSGNVSEWVEDCWHDSYHGSPSDGSAWSTACTDVSRRVVRGGSWINDPRSLRSAYRAYDDMEHRTDVGGFRVARTLDQ